MNMWKIIILPLTILRIQNITIIEHRRQKYNSNTAWHIMYTLLALNMFLQTEKLLLSQYNNVKMFVCMNFLQIRRCEYHLWQWKYWLIVCIGDQPPPQKHHPLFLAKPLKSANCRSPLFRQSPPLYWLFVNFPLKVGFFSESPKY